MSGETEKDISGWTVDTLRVHFDREFEALRTILDERYATQTKATDAAFAAQQTAMAAALASAERAVQTALTSAEKAVDKAERAAERRFESVNEFRQTLSDQAQTFMPRAEAIALIDRVGDRIEGVNALLDGLAGRVDRSEGHGEGVKMSGTLLGGVIAAVAAIVVIVNVVILLVTG